MTNPRTLLIGLGATVALGVIAVALLRNVAPSRTDEATPAPRPDQATEAIADTQTGAAPTVAAAEPPPPWASAVPAGEAAQAAEDTAALRREQHMADLQQSMSAVLDDALARSVSSSEHLRKALDALEAMEDPAVNARINLAALRHNLEISLQMQDVARRLKAEVGLPRSAEGDARIEALRREFAALQTQLRADVSATPGGP